MKYLKSIYSILEKQMKLFPDYEKEFPDNPKKVAMKYIKSRETEHDKTTDKVNTWELAQNYMNDYENNNKAKKEAFDDWDRGSFDSTVDDIYDIHIYTLIEYALEYASDNGDNYDRDLIDDVEDTDEMETIFTEIGLDWDDFEKICIDRYEEDEIHKRIEEDSTTEGVLDWTDSEKGILYRAMTISGYENDINDIKEKGVGIYWSYVREGAEAHGGGYGKHYSEIILVARVEPSDVNWDSTIMKSYYSLSEEQEIELKQNTTIEIIGFEITSTHPHFSDMQDKDEKYFEEVLDLDYDTILKITKNKGSFDIILETPIVVKTEI